MGELRTRHRVKRGDGRNHPEKQELRRISCASQFTIPDTAGLKPDPACDSTHRRSSQHSRPSHTADFLYPLVFSILVSSCSPISLFLILNSTVIAEYTVQSTLTIAPCRDHELPPSIAYPEYSIHGIPKTPSTVHTKYSIHQVQHTPSTAYTKYSIHQVQHTPSTAYTEYSIHQVQHTPSTAYTKYSIYRVQHTPSTAYTEYSIHRIQHTLSKAFTEYSIHRVHEHSPNTAFTKYNIR
jgi:uncharacterized protein (UPF0248 family)